MPMKPVKRGIKVWVRADAENGFVSEFRVYTGKQDGVPEQGLGYKVIHELTRPLVGKIYHIICDNLGLAEDLLKDKLYLCGTTRVNRKDFPKDLNDKERVKELRRGEAIIRQKGNIVATIWKDKKPVAFLSTQSNATGDVTVSKKQKDGSVIEVPFFLTCCKAVQQVQSRPKVCHAPKPKVTKYRLTEISPNRNIA
ncbi:hypothetical protein QZH41_007563 [Actinostola sp. cb2023]|nr:hypothetical protein QZH41_007563 [Actinostola sp. cb2023]